LPGGSKDPPLDGWEKRLFADDEGIDSVKQAFADVALAEESVNADAFGFFDEVLAFVHGVEKDGSVREKAVDFFGRGETTENRHGEIENDEIGLEFHGFVDGIAAIGNLGADFDAGTRKQDHTNTFAHGVVIVSNKDADQGGLFSGTLVAQNSTGYCD
jgi:hypothetical protein